MSAKLQCPPAETLERLLLGLLSAAEAESLGEHVLHCDLCGNSLHALSREDGLVAAVRQAPAVTGTWAPPSLVENVIERASRLRPSEAASATESGATTTPPNNQPILKTSSEEFVFLAPPAQADEIGRLGSYRVLRVLGQGGMGIVFLAEDLNLGRPVALKVLRPERGCNPSERQRFLREARSAAALTHDHIVSVHQVGEENGIPYLAMQLLQGETLEARLRREGKLPPAEAVRIAREIASGLEAAHAAGLMHRDVKPDNIWLEGDGGRVKLLDFGLARGIADKAHLTETGTITGTPAYMAPEQARGRPDFRSDLFSLGCVLYRMCLGTVPFTGADALAILAALAIDQPRPPRVVDRSVPSALSDVVMKLLAKRPEERYGSAQEVLAALDAWERSPERAPRRRRARLAVLAGLLLVVAVIAIVALRRVTPSTEAPPADELAALTKRFDTLHTDPADPRIPALRKDLLAYVGRYQGQTVARQAVDLLARLPWPIDALRPDTISPIELAAASDGDTGRPPPGLVAIWGDSSWSDWGGINAAAYSPDGKTLATAGWTSMIQLRDVTTGRPRLTLRGHPEEVWSLAYSPDGKTLASGSSDGTIKLWDTATGKERRTLRGHTDTVFGLAFRPDGTALASAGRDGIARLWAVASGREIHVLRGHTNEVYSVAFDPDGHTLATASNDTTVKLWKVDSGGLHATLTGHEQGVRSVVISPDGKKLYSVSWDGTIKVRGLPEGRLQHTIPVANNIHSLAISPNGKLLATGRWSGEVEIWDAVTGKRQGDLHGHKWIVPALAFSPDGTALASGSWDYTVRIWNVADGLELGRPHGHEARRYAAVFSPDGRTVASVSQEGMLTLRAAATGEVIHAEKGADERMAVAFSPDGSALAVGSSSCAVEIFDSSTGKLLKSLKGHRSPVRAVAFSPDGKTLASGSFDRKVKLWNLAEGMERETLEGHTNDVYSVAFSPDGKWLASGGLDDRVFVWDTATRQQQREWMVQGSGVASVTFSPDSQTLAVACRNSTVKFWDLAAGRERLLEAFPQHTSGVYSVAYSPDGRLLASTGEDGTVRIWDARTGTPRDRIRLGPARRDIWHVAFGPDGRHLVTANGNSTVYVFRLSPALRESEGGSQDRPFAEIRRFTGHTNYVVGVAFSADGRRAYSSSFDKTVREWDVATGVELGKLKGHDETTWGLALTNDGRLLTSSFDRTVRVWNIAERRELFCFKDHTERVSGIALAPDGKRVLSADWGGTVLQWDLASGKVQHTLAGDRFWGACVAFSPDGRLAASSMLGQIGRVWDVESGKTQYELHGAPGTTTVNFSHDGRYVVTGAERDRIVRLWDAVTGQELQHFGGHERGVRSAVFSPKDRYLLVGGEDGIRLWDIASGRLVGEFVGHTKMVTSVAISPDGRYALSGSDDRTVRLWRLPPEVE